MVAKVWSFIRGSTCWYRIQRELDVSVTRFSFLVCGFGRGVVGGKTGREEMKKFWKGLPIWLKVLLLAMLPIINYGISLLWGYHCKASGRWVGDCAIDSFLLFLLMNVITLLLAAAAAFWFLIGRWLKSKKRGR